MTSIRSAAAASLCVVALLVGCGSSSNPAATKIRASYTRLLNAYVSRDAATECELILPFPQDQPRSALVKVAHRLASPSAAAEYRRYVASCASEVSKKPENVSGYYSLRGFRLGTVSVHGPIATALVTYRTGERGTATFVDAAGEWRLVIGFQ